MRRGCAGEHGRRHRKTKGDENAKLSRGKELREKKGVVFDERYA
jgi:hypothetical protein